MWLTACFTSTSAANRKPGACWEVPSCGNQWAPDIVSLSGDWCRQYGVEATDNCSAPMWRPVISSTRQHIETYSWRVSDLLGEKVRWTLLMTADLLNCLVPADSGVKHSCKIVEFGCDSAFIALPRRWMRPFITEQKLVNNYVVTANSRNFVGDSKWRNVAVNYCRVAWKQTTWLEPLPK